MNNDKAHKIKEQIRAKNAHKSPLQEKGGFRARWRNAHKIIKNTLSISSSFAKNTLIPIAATSLFLLNSIILTVTTLTNPDKSVRERIRSLILGSVFLSIAITIFVAGPVAAASAGLIAAFINMSFNAMKTLGIFYRLLKASKAYTHRKKFDVLLNSNRDDLRNNSKFDDLLEIRAVELKYKNNLSDDENRLFQFINTLGRINLGKNDKLAIELEALYTKRVLLSGLFVQKLDQESSEDSINSSLPIIHGYQNELARVDMQINQITASQQDLRAKKIIAAQELSLSFAQFMLQAWGVALAALSIVLIVGTMALAPYVAPLAIYLGLALAGMELIHFAAEKIVQYKQSRVEKELLKAREEVILDEGFKPLINNERPSICSPELIIRELSSEKPPNSLPIIAHETPVPQHLSHSIPKEPSIFAHEEECITSNSGNTYTP